MMVNQQRRHTCHECGREYMLDRTTRQCSNCFGCTGCEEYLCPYCGCVHVVQLPRNKRTQSKDGDYDSQNTEQQ